MNREIKFRAWCHEWKYMTTDIEFSQYNTFDKKPQFYYTNAEDGIVIEEPYFAIMQYTGLKDKEGREIYEGDILRVKAFDGWFDDIGYYHNIEVKHKQISSGDSDIIGYIYIPKDREIIGNIYQNTDLLK